MNNNDLFQSIKNAKTQIEKLKEQAQILDSSNIANNNIDIRQYKNSIIYSLNKADRNIEKSYQEYVLQLVNQKINKLPSINNKKQEQLILLNGYRKYKKIYQQKKSNNNSKNQSESTKIQENNFLDLAVQNRQLKFHSHHEKHIKPQYSTQNPHPKLLNIPKEMSSSSKRSVIQTAMRRNFYRQQKSIKYINLTQNQHQNDLPQSLLKSSFTNDFNIYQQSVDKYSKHQFMIINGKLIDEGPQYLSYKRIYQSNFLKIKSNIVLIQQMISQNQIDFIKVDGKKLAYLSLKSNLKKEDLLDCLIDGDELKDKLINKKKFEGKDGMIKAANLIISGLKMIKQKTKFKKMKEAAIVIQRFLRKKGARLNLQKKIAQKNQQILVNFEKKQQAFRVNWNKIKTEKRIEIHINSLQFDEHKRLTIENFNQRQNTQFSRIFRLRDNNLIIIYVTSRQLPIEVINYYYRMLDLGGIQSYKDRLIFMDTETSQKFPNHFSLSKLLYYSSKSLKKLKVLCEELTTIIIPSYPSNVIVKISDFLGCYVFCSQPQKLKQISTKSQFRRFCMNLRIEMLPGTMQMYDYMQFVNTFAVLIVKNPQIQTWVLKIDDEFNGRGISYFEVSKSKYIQSILKKCSIEQKNTSQVFTTNVPVVTPLNQEITLLIRDYLKENLRSTLKIATPSVYRNYTQFMGRFIKKGGIIEAVPPCLKQNLKYPSVSFCLQPNGQYRIIAAYQKIIGKPFRSIGCSFPQNYVQLQSINNVLMEICESFNFRHIFGFFTLDFVYYQKQDIKKTWVIDIEPYLNDYTSSFYLFDCLMNGSYFPQKNLYVIEKQQQQSVQATNSLFNKQIAQRQYIYIPQFNNPNILKIKIKQFFKQARMQGHNFNIGNKQGLCVLLLDELTSGSMGLLSISNHKKQNIQRLKQVLQFITNITHVKNVTYGQNQYYTSTDSIMIKDVISVFITMTRKEQRKNAKQKAFKKYQQSTNLQLII